MFSKSSLVFLLLTILYEFGGMRCQSVFPGVCPPRTSTELLNLKEIHGTWYEIERSPIMSEFALKCVTIRVQQFYDQQSNVMVKYIDRISGKKSHLQLKVQADPDFMHNGQLNQISIPKPNDLHKFTFQILSTDYRNYMILWGCQNFVAKAHSELLWIFGRNHEVDIKEEANYTGQIHSMGLSHVKLELVHQTRCNLKE